MQYYIDIVHANVVNFTFEFGNEARKFCSKKDSGGTAEDQGEPGNQKMINRMVIWCVLVKLEQALERL